MNRFVSRKFLLLILFAGIVVYNSWVVQGQALTWESLLVLATMFGIYGGANIAEKIAVGEEYYEDEEEIDEETPEDGEDA